MTVRVTTLKGVGAGAYYVEHLPNYYLDADEPAGRWFGDGAARLGLDGEVDPEAFLALMAGLYSGQGERLLGRAFEEKSVRGFDVTCSAPKSVSVLFALGNPHVRTEVLAAHDAAVAAVAGWIEAHAHTRYRIAGEVAVVDAEGIVAACFRQHTSRALDPQLHTHLVIVNRVVSPDGRWLALDARLIKHDQQSLSALYHAGLRAELTGRLGIRWQPPEHGIAEMVDVPAAVLAAFSTRTGEVRRRIDEKVDRFVDTMDRDPTPRERWRLEREAAVDSRPAKPDALNAAVLHEQWATQADTLGHDPAQLVTTALGRVRHPAGIDRTTGTAVVDQAVVAMAERQSSWRPTQLHREIAAAIPTTTGAPADALVRWIDQTVEGVVEERCVELSAPIPPEARLRRDGRPVSESVLDRALSTQAIIIEEDNLLAWADRRLAYDGSEHPDAPARSRVRLNAVQVQAAAAVAGSDDLVLIVGPAGTGKTIALAPAVAQLRADGRVVFGVAPSATAAQVLSGEAGVVADTLDKLLVEHRSHRGPDRRFALPVGATVIVDEAGMVPTARLAELADLADVRGWRVVLVGDPLQFAAVGRGGMFGLLTDAFGAVELDQVRRFTHTWERAASLQLRRGDVEVADLYHAHDRLHGGTPGEMERAVVARWWLARQSGVDVLLMAPTVDAVERLNQRCQHSRLRTRDLDAAGPTITAGPYQLHVGDEIATRHNDRTLTTDRGDMVRNRATWTITALHPDQSLTASGTNGTVHLPAGYVAEHVELAYARTAMAAQGRTVTQALLYLDGPTTVRNLYVPMTRGRDTNEAFIATTGEQSALEVFAVSIATDWIDQPAHVRRDELHHTTSHRPGLFDGPALRQLLEDRHQLVTTVAHAERQIDRAPNERRHLETERSAAQQRGHNARTTLDRAHAVLDEYDRPLRRRKHTTEIADAHHAIKRLPTAIQQAAREAQAVVGRLDQLAVRVAEAETILDQRPRLEQKLAEIDDQLETDRRVRTRITRLEQPAAIVDVLGPRPRTSDRARAWDDAAGRLHQHQAAFNIDHGIGPHPGYFTDTAYSHNHADIEHHIAAAVPRRHRAIERDTPGIEIDF